MGVDEELDRVEGGVSRHSALGRHGMRGVQDGLWVDKLLNERQPGIDELTGTLWKIAKCTTKISDHYTEHRIN